jgi:predicted Zn-dependent protease
MRLMRSSSAVAIPLTLLVAGLVSSCAVNPATGQRQFSLISESREIEIGREADGEITGGFGVYDDAELASYVSKMGHKLAATSERPDLPWTFQVLDDPIVNAFALPGGFVYVTRGILAHLNSDAELAGVLGHEIGHVTARHSVSQMSRQQLQQIGIGVGGLLSQDIKNLGEVLQAGFGLLNLRYGRGDESQSDELGVRYMGRAGYDARELIHVFQTLELVSGDPQDRLPEWQSTHPTPENRERRIEELIAESGVDYSEAREGVSNYSHRIDGLAFGPNPREGFFQGTLFRHPSLRFRLRFPNDWKTANERTRVVATDPDENVMMVLMLEDDGVSPSEAAASFAEDEDIQAGSARGVSINGLRAQRMDFSVEDGDKSYAGQVAFVELAGQTYKVLGLGTEAGWKSWRRGVVSAISSFAEETDRRVLSVQPWRIEMVTLPTSTTGSGFIKGWPSVAPAEDIYRINRISADEVIPKGRVLKRVIGRPLPG